MKHLFPPQGQNFTYLQTNRSDVLGSLWSTFNLDFQSNLGRIRLANKLVTNTTSSDDGDLGLPVAFEFWYDEWWAICGTRVFHNSSPELTAPFVEDTTGYSRGTSTTQFDVTNPAGITFRYTWDGTGTDPTITALTFPIGSTVVISGTNMAAGNNGTFTVTGSGANYFEVSNASGVAENDKTIGSGIVTVSGGSFGQDYGVGSDLKVFNDKLWATSGILLWSKASPTSPWLRVSQIVSGTGVPAPLVYFKKFDRIYFVNNVSLIHSVDTSSVVATTGNFTIEIGKSIGYITSMVNTSSFIWIGSFRVNSAVNASNSELKGTISQWDAFSNQVTNEFLLTTAGVLAMCVYQDVPYAMDSEGRVLKYTGYSFEEIARLPINRTLLTMPTTLGVSHFVHFNGMAATKNNTILVNINNLNDDVQADVSENIASGIWELDLATNNFTHKYAPTQKARSSSTITDYGQNRISAVGAIKVNTLQSANADGRSTLLAGYTYYTDATTVKSGIFIDSPAKPTTDNEGQKRGYFVTSWFESNEITDNWTRLWTIYRRFLNSTDKIIPKFRLNEEAAVLANITWTSTTTFTTTTDVSAYAPTVAPFEGITGGEVEILQGTGSGSNTHITSVSFSTPTYTVTLDTAVTGVTGTAKARLQKWIKLPEITGQVLSYGSAAIALTNPRIQIKGEMQFTGDNELHRMILNSEQDLKAIT